jgi:hypothetical protein
MNELGALSNSLRDLPSVAARIGEGERPHTPVTVCRATDHRYSALIQFGVHCIRVLNDDRELSDSFLRQVQDVRDRAVLVSLPALQDTYVSLKRNIAVSSSSCWSGSPKTSQ